MFNRLVLGDMVATVHNRHTRGNSSSVNSVPQLTACGAVPVRNPQRHPEVSEIDTVKKIAVFCSTINSPSQHIAVVSTIYSTIGGQT
jgi:hypothetical protein